MSSAAFRSATASAIVQIRGQSLEGVTDRGDVVSLLEGQLNDQESTVRDSTSSIGKTGGFSAKSDEADQEGNDLNFWVTYTYEPNGLSKSILAVIHSTEDGNGELEWHAGAE